MYNNDLANIDISSFDERLKIIEYIYENTNPIVTKTGTDTCPGPIKCESSMYRVVLFDEPFMGVPTVTATKTSSHKYCNIHVQDVTQTGFTLRYANVASASNHDNITNIKCTWIAEWKLKNE